MVVRLSASRAGAPNHATCPGIRTIEENATSATDADVDRRQTSHVKNRSATTAPITVQMAGIARWSAYQPELEAIESNCSGTALSACLSGSAEPSHASGVGVPVDAPHM
jgi:hypothetical protein